ncbi:MAG TPA: alanyl-tRNA editing protein [Candidatus Polarisedimenticolaceae bacterium]|nr:alanyl-tRNA editing protein [Candidatus Polarisedimenticolaceae bacterium]
MPDRKLFYDEPRRTRLSTSIVAAERSGGGFRVRLDETIFYPEGGGQPADRGSIGGATVLDVVSRGAEVWHELDREVPAGPVSIVLDEQRRFDHCQQHTAQHLLTAVLLDGHARPTTSFHLGSAHTAIEITGPVLSKDKLRALERAVNAHLREDRAVTARWVAPEELATLPVRSRGLPAGHVGPVRLVEIEGLDLNTCGGTHVSRLGEIQGIEILDAEAARGGTRIRFLAGERMFADLDRRRDLEDALRARIGTAAEEFPSILDAREGERKRLARRVEELEERLAAAAVSSLPVVDGRFVTAVRPGDGPDELRALARAIVEGRPQAVAVLAGEGCFLVQAGPEGPEDVAEIGARVRDLVGARGGGRGRTFQGKGGARPAQTALEAAVREGA